MASPPFAVEDQADEDFFDKLVDDVVDGVQSGSSFTKHVESNDVQALAKLSINEISYPADGLDNIHSIIGDHCEKSENDWGISSKLDREQNVADEDGGHIVESSKLVDPKGVTEFGDHVVGEESVFDSMDHGSSVNAGGGIKEVQWSAFSVGREEASYSDFFNELGDNTADPFAELAGSSVITADPAVGASFNQANCSSSHSFLLHEETKIPDSSIRQTTETQHEETHGPVSSIRQATETQDESSSQYWETLYPGWRYDPNTGQWYELDSSHAMENTVESYDVIDKSTSERAAINPISDAYYLQQTAQSVVGSVAEKSTTGTLSYWNQTGQGSTEYPAHMVFDPQYPGWYYDSIALEWRSLDSYSSLINQSASLDHNQHTSNGSFTTDNYYGQNMNYEQGKQVNNYSHEQDQPMNRRDSGNYHHQDMKMVQPEPFGNSEAVKSPQNTPFGNGYMSSGQVNYSADHRGSVTPSEKSPSYEQTSHGFDSTNDLKKSQGFSNGVVGFASSERFLQANDQRNMDFEQQYSAAYFNGPDTLNFTQQPFQDSRQLFYASSEGRSSAGRPPHALVAFGFGGKLIYASQDSVGSVISVLDMFEASIMKSDGADVGFSSCDYFRTLCQQSFPGPLVSGNMGTKELNKWIDDRIANYAIPQVEYRKCEALRLLFSLLKIACQFYGKLRSGFSTDLGLKENDCPESTLAKLFASGKRNGSQFSAIAHCLQYIPSEGQIQATADEVQMLLVSGKRVEALQCAQEGQLWGPAIIIAAMLGEQFYGETVKQMAVHQLVAGSPLRTLCLLLAGQPAEVFSNPLMNNPPSGLNVAQPAQIGPTGMLDDWEENLAIITANRTAGDELVITHLGDCLWKERGEVIAAHICYLIAEANIESYSESARLCLIGADHLKNPRTYASPEAIQRTELYEYAKVLGNSQFILPPFQPYKLIYACMLAEVGKLADSLKYCQAALKSLKAGRSSEVDAWRHMISSLEERIKIHHQGGYATNLAPKKLVGKLLNFFDNTAHRVVGGLPPPAPAQSHSNGQHSEPDNQSRGPRVSTSQSTMAMSSLMPSAPTEGSSRTLMYNRSISEPNFGRTPRKIESPTELNSSEQHENASASPGSSRLGLFGSQIFQKTVGFVLRSRSDRQAKLGEKNKFYYDEKLKRWVEEGAAPPAEEPALAPPPTTTAFMNGMPDNNTNGEFVNSTIHANGEPEFKAIKSTENLAGTPPIPLGSNQFSARGRMGVRARYVDTFNKGGGGAQANSFQSPSPSITAMKPSVGNAKFFIPTPVAGGQESESTVNPQARVLTDEDTSTSDRNHSFSPPPMPMRTPSPVMQKHPSMESIPSKGIAGTANGNGPLPPHSRRTLSWSGGLPLNPLSPGETRPPGEALGLTPSTYMPSNPPPAMPFTSNSTTVTDDLQEVLL